MEAAPPAPPPRRTALIVAGITLVGLLLRLLGLGGESFWQDEAWSWWTIRGGFGEALKSTIEADLHPPLYYSILWLWSRFGDSEAWLRLPSALFAAASIPLLYRIGARWFGENAGLCAALLLALSANATYFGQEVRSYALVSLIAVAAANVVESGFKGRSIALGVLLGLLGLTHYVGGFFAIVVAAWLIARREGRVLAISAVTAAVVFAPWSPFFIRQMARANAGFWIPPPTPRELWSSLLEWTYFPHYVPSWGLRVAGVALLVAVAGGFWFNRRTLAGRISGLWAAAPIVISLILSFRLSIFYTRSLAYILPAWFLLAAAWPRRCAFQVMALLVLGLTAGQLAMRATPQKEDWRGAAAFTAQRSDAAVAYWPGDLQASGAYYLRTTPVGRPWFALPPEGYAAGSYSSEHLERLIGEEGPRHVWLFTRHGRKHVGAADFARFEDRYAFSGVEGRFQGVLVELWIRRAQGR